MRSWLAGISWGAAKLTGDASVRVASEPVYKGAHTSYKARDKKSKQEEMFPKLKAEIEKKREARYSGKQFTAEERFGDEFRAELAKIAMGKIGGPPRNRRCSLILWSQLIQTCIGSTGAHLRPFGINSSTFGRRRERSRRRGSPYH